MGKLVKFNHDIYPYVKGDVVNLEKDALAEIDTIAKKRDIDTPYENATAKSTDDEAKATAQAEADRQAAEDQAKLEAEAKGTEQAEPAAAKQNIAADPDATKRNGK